MYQAVLLVRKHLVKTLVWQWEQSFLGKFHDM